MNEQVFGLWIDALKSGEYEEGHGGLSFNGAFCPLGVLCDLARKEGYVTARDMRIAGGAKVTLYDNCRGNIPPAVWEFIGIRRPAGSPANTLAIGGFPIIKLFDHARLSFGEIAEMMLEHGEVTAVQV